MSVYITAHVRKAIQVGEQAGSLPILSTPFVNGRLEYILIAPALSLTARSASSTGLPSMTLRLGHSRMANSRTPSAGSACDRRGSTQRQRQCGRVAESYTRNS